MVLAAIFQSTPPRGGRPGRCGLDDAAHRISIHAPAWGATESRCSISGRTYFNPRPRVGGDVINSESTFFISVFQSTPPRGGRPYLVFQCACYCYFNPRPRVGGDLTAVSDTSFPLHFNPRPRVGGDPSAGVIVTSPGISIHAPAWGATDTSAPVFNRNLFQSTPPRGGRLSSPQARDGLFYFNPRPRVGGDH